MSHWTLPAVDNLSPEEWGQQQYAISDSYIAGLRRRLEPLPDSDDELGGIRRQVLESQRLDEDLELEAQHLRFLVITAGLPDPLPSHRPRPRRRSFIGARKNLKIMEVV